MAVDDIYQIRCQQIIPGNEPQLNVFYYRVTAGDSSADDLNSAFANDLWDLVRAIQIPGVITNRYECINGMDNSDFEISEASDAGLSIATTMSARFVAVGFRSPAPPPGGNYAYKRIGGIASSLLGTTDGSFIPGQLDNFVPIQNGLGASLEGTNALYDPVLITGGFKLGVSPTFQRSVKGQWSTNIYPSSQVTRKAYAWQVLSV